MFFFTLLAQVTVEASEDSLKTNGEVAFEGDIPSVPIDPENPANPVDPGPGPSTKGPLRIDFVSQFDLGKNKITATDRLYYANAQLFHDGTEARGNYIQITDQRIDKKGWTLQVKQEHQFKNEVIQPKEQQELRGAALTLGQGWANSAFTLEKAPKVNAQDIEINELGTSYDVAVAEPGSGRGTWTIEFGASDSNKNNRTPTLFKKMDTANKPVVDPIFENQQIYGNKAVFLSVPDKTIIYPVYYQTVFTWILSELPI